MSDLISRHDAIIALLEKGQKSRRYKVGDIWELNFDEIREALATVPSADPERKKGKWIKTDEREEWYGDIYVCSLCGYRLIDANEKYCPNCGADMREEK